MSDRRKELAKEKQKLAQLEAGGVGDYDENLKKDIERRIERLKDEISSLNEAASTHKNAFRGQISRIKETISKILYEDKTLGKKIRTLFRVQGITIFSILTAIGMAIIALFEAFTGSAPSPPSPGPSPPSPPPSQEPSSKIKEWLEKLGKFLHGLPKKQPLRYQV